VDGDAFGRLRVTSVRGEQVLDRVHQILPHGSFGSRYPAAMLPQW